MLVRLGLLVGVLVGLWACLGREGGLGDAILPESARLALHSLVTAAISAQLTLLGHIRDSLGSDKATEGERAATTLPSHPSANTHLGYSAQFNHNTRKGNYRRDHVSFLPEPSDHTPWHNVEDEEDEEDALAIVPPLPSASQQNEKTSKELEAEALATLEAAKTYRERGKTAKARRLFDHALALAPNHPDVLNELGLHMENSEEDPVEAERLYRRALAHAPAHPSALANRARTLPLVEESDQRILSSIDALRQAFLSLPRNSAALRRAMKEAYYLHVYHTVAIEGNTMSLIQTRSILETHLSVGGKSVVEHNEILGMDQALRYLNKTLLNRIGDITIHDIKEIHYRVLGFVDPFNAGKFRDHQVYVGDFTPVPPERILPDMQDFIDWLNSDDALSIHPVEMAAIAHYKFVYIHPFVDGNGRTARLLMNLILMQAGFPPVIIRVEDRVSYYETLKWANEGDLRPFIRFIAAATDRTLASYLAATTTSAWANQRNIAERETPSSGQLVPDSSHLLDDLFQL